MGTTDDLCSVGSYGLKVECGQHDDPAGADVAHHTVRQTLAPLGIADLPLAPPASHFACLALAVVVARHAEAAASPEPGPTPTPQAAAALIAVLTVGSELRPPEAGYIIFPDVSALPGHEWFSIWPRPPEGRCRGWPGPDAQQNESWQTSTQGILIRRLIRKFTAMQK